MSSNVVAVTQELRLRHEPVMEAFAPVSLPSGTAVETLSLEKPGWVKLRGQVDDQPLTGWCMRRMFGAAQYAPIPAFPSAERRIWDLVLEYTDKVGYERGAKASSLEDNPPVIDCSGWVAFLLNEAMNAQNYDAGEHIFEASDIDVRDPWSDRTIVEIESRTPLLLEGAGVNASNLSRNATIGVNEGYQTWQSNRPRLRGINHIAQVVRRPADQAPFVSDSYSIDPGGVRLTPLDEWLDTHAANNRVWSVDPFALADPFSKWVMRARDA